VQALSSGSPHAANGQSAHQPAQQQQQPVGSRIHKLIRQGLPELDSNSKINPQTPSRTKIENLINF